MMDIETYKSLGSDDVLVKVALLTGFIQTLRCNDYLENPLGSLCCALIAAIIYSCLAKIVINICPEFLKPMISIVLIMSMIYYIFFKKSCDPDTTNGFFFLRFSSGQSNKSN